MVFCTHDIAEAERHGDRVLVLADGELLFDGPPADLKAEATADEDEDLEQAFVNFLRTKVIEMHWIVLKDVQILRRSKLLVGLLIIYPIAIATLMGFALSSSPEKPRVAYLNQVPANRAESGSAKRRSISVRTPRRFWARSRRSPSRTATRPSRRSTPAARRPRSSSRRTSPSSSPGGLASASIEVIYNGDALKLSLVDSTISAKLRPPTPSSPAEPAPGQRLHRRSSRRRRDRRARHELPDPRLEELDSAVDAALADNATAASKRRLGPVSKFAHLALANSGRATAVF